MPKSTMHVVLSVAIGVYLYLCPWIVVLKIILLYHSMDDISTCYSEKTEMCVLAVLDSLSQETVC